MPCLRILTNLPASKIPKDFVNKIIPVLARAIRKDDKLFTIVVAGDCHVSWAGDSNGLAAVATLESIGNVGPEDNKATATAVSQFVHKELGILPERVFLSFYDVAAHNITKGGVTLAEKK